MVRRLLVLLAAALLCAPGVVSAQPPAVSTTGAGAGALAGTSATDFPGVETPRRPDEPWIRISRVEGLVDGAVVRVAAGNFTPGITVAIGQCMYESGFTSMCDADTLSEHVVDARGDVAPIDVRLEERIVTGLYGEFDCRQPAACSVGAMMVPPEPVELLWRNNVARGVQFLPAPPEPDDRTTFTCTVPTHDTSAEYRTTLGVRAEGDGTIVTATLSTAALPGVVPHLFGRAPMTAEVTALVGGRRTTLRGAHEVNAAPNVPLPVPPVSGSVTSSASSVDVVVEHATYVIEHPEIAVRFHCVPTSPATVAGVPVAPVAPSPSPSPEPPPVPTRVTTTTKVTGLEHARTARKFTRIRVRAKVTRAGGPASGRARIVLKRGTKNVAVVKGVKLNRNGVVNRVVKRLGKKVTRPGKYRVVVRYVGNDRFAPSRAARQFRLR